MALYVALLRGINVSGHHKMKMIDLKALLLDLGLQQVKTYLQSGNVIFSSELNDTAELEVQISNAVHKGFGYDIRIKVIEKADFQNIIKSNPFLSSSDIDTKQLYYIHLMGKANLDAYQILEKDVKYPEKMHLIAETLFVHYAQGYGRSKLHGGIIEKKLSVAATARNHNTMKNLGELLNVMN